MTQRIIEIISKVIKYNKNKIHKYFCRKYKKKSHSISACLKKADLAFLVDSSSSVGSGNFQKLENFLKNAVTKLDIGKDKVHVGLMQYSSYPSMQFPLNMYTNRGDTLKAIEGMQFMGGDTNTGDAIQNMRQQMFSQTGGARNNVPRIAIVVTDGGSSNNAKTTQQADGARRDHIGLISVGVGSAVNSYELQLIADDQTKVVKVNSFDQLEQAVDQILQKACTGKYCLSFLAAKVYTTRCSICFYVSCVYNG